MADKSKKNEDQDRTLRPAEAIQHEFDEPGAGRPLDEAALVLGEDGKPVEPVVEEEPEDRSRGALFREPRKEHGSGGDDKAAMSHVENTGAGVATSGPSASSIPGGGRREPEDS